MIRIDRKLIHQIIYFGIVGGVTFLIDVSVTTALYDLAHFPAYLSSAIGFISGFFFNFPVNRKRVFHHSDKDKFALKTQIAMYAILGFFNLLATSLITQLLVSYGHLHIAYAKAGVTIMIGIWNFIIFKLLVFSKKEGTKANKLDERTLADIF